MTQCQLLLSELKKGKRITRWYAAFDLGVMELSSRMGDLESKGYFIAKEWVKVKTKSGERSFKEYWLDTDYSYFAKEFIRSAA